MGTKHYGRSKGLEEGTPRSHSADSAANAGPPSRRLVPIVVGIGLGVVVLGSAALFGPMFRDREGAAAPRAAETKRPSVPPLASPPITLPPSAQGPSALPELPPPTESTPRPLNDTDPLTGKPILPTSPTTTYKGYEIGFCCTDSAAYRGGWERMSETQKDAFVWRCLSKQGGS